MEVVARGLTAAYPGGPSHKAGDLVVLASSALTQDGPVAFTMPSPVAMALKVAVASGIAADKRRRELTFQTVPGPHGMESCVAPAQEPLLFDFFEHCMIAVTFSFQSVESFANFIVAQKLKSTMCLQRGEKTQEYDAAGIQRNVPTAEKLSTVLPALLSVPNPKGSKIWQEFVELRRLRDSTVHLKSTDQYGKNPQNAIDSLFFNFFNRRATDFPRLALDIAEYFSRDRVPRWLRGARLALARG